MIESALLDEYIERYSNWGRWGDDDQVGTANFVDPFIWTKLIDGMREYMTRHRISQIADLVGTIDTSSREKQWVSS